MKIEDAVEKILGINYKIVYQVNIFLMSFSVGIAYFIYLDKYSEIILNDLLKLGLNNIIRCLIVGSILFLTLLIRRVDDLKYMSIIGLFIVLSTITIFTIDGLIKINKGIH